MEKGNIANEELAELIKSGFDQLSEEIVAVRSDLSVKIDSVRTELKNDIAGVRNELSSEMSSVRTEISALRSEMQEGFLKTNDKVDLLTEKLVNKNVITKMDAEEVMAINPLSLS